MPAKPPGSTRFLPQVRAAMRLRRLSPRTEETYLAWILRYLRHHGTRRPGTMGEPEVLGFLNWLVVDRRVAHSTQMQALSALLFLYRDVLRRQPRPIFCFGAARPSLHAPQQKRESLCRLGIPLPHEPREGHR
jgi:hypothetical protein